jgi:predicted methyltransferase
MKVQSKSRAVVTGAVRKYFGLALAGASALVLVATASPPAARAQGTPDYAKILAAPDRSAADRKNDARREPAKVLAFAGVRPGMTVLDMGADAGYSTDIIARVVGSTGKVYGQNPPNLPERIKARFDERLKTFPLKNIVPVVRPMDDPVPPGVGNLDLITFFFAYHDTAYQPEIDRAKMNRALFAALKPGGSFVVADHAAAPGAGLSVVKKLHRIDEATLKQEVEAAGFKLVDEAKFLRHPEDPHTQSVFQRKTDIDDFLLRFEKPRS